MRPRGIALSGGRSLSPEPHRAARMASVGYDPGDMSCAIDERRQRSRHHPADEERGEDRKLEH
jgi:hypothetical protein